MMNELKNCPFCGGEAELFETHEKQFGIIHSNTNYLCPISDSESFQGGWTYDTKDEAIKAWNTRKPIDDILEKLEDLQQPCYECRESCNEKCVIERAIEIVKEGRND